MKTRFVSARLLLTCFMLIATLFTGCFNYNKPPDVSSVQQKFQKNHSSIKTIVAFLIDSGYDNIYITNADGTMLADLKSMQISNTEVSSAINQLLKNEEYIQIGKIGNTVHFLQWRGLRDIGCGIAYTINEIDPPEVEFMTELVPISDDGWFYYISDYNSWRNAINSISGISSEN